MCHLLWPPNHPGPATLHQHLPRWLEEDCPQGHLQWPGKVNNQWYWAQKGPNYTATASTSPQNPCFPSPHNLTKASPQGKGEVSGSDFLYLHSNDPGHQCRKASLPRFLWHYRQHVQDQYHQDWPFCYPCPACLVEGTLSNGKRSSVPLIIWSSRVS